MAKRKRRPAEPKSQEWKDLKSRLGRRDWNGLDPTTRVVPNKKRPKEARKLKHKGRESDPFLFEPGSNMAKTTYSSYSF